MADHEVNAAQLHAIQHPAGAEKDMAGGRLSISAGASRKASVVTNPEKPSHELTPDEEEPTEEEKAALRHVPEGLPISAWLVALIEFCERFTYYGLSGIFQNYVVRPRDGSLGVGALGRGKPTGTALSNFFQFWCYLTPILGAIIADQYLGRYKTIVLFAGVYFVGLLILWTTALPGSLEAGAGFPGYVVAIIVIGLGTGGIKSNVAPLIADQYTRKKMAIKTLAKTGERVILDPELTYQRIYMIFYLCINIGSLSLLATPYMELYVDFWSAYLLGFCMFGVGFTVLILGRKLYIVRPPQGGVIVDAFHAMFIMLKHWNKEAAKPSFQQANLPEAKRSRTIRWNDHFIEELKRALKAMKVFILFPIFWLIYNQFSNNFVNQAAQMNGHGIPNDLMQNFDPIAIIVAIPILDRFVYPALAKMHIRFLPISRITVGFFVASLSVLYAAVLQDQIYKTGPCFDHPQCDAAIVDGVAQGNDIHIAIQTPAYIFVGLAEVFLSVTGLEYAYTKAPASMKSFVQSMFLLTNAVAAAVGIAFAPLAADPQVLWLFASLAIVAFITAIVFWFCFRHYNALEDEMNALEAYDENEDINKGHRQPSVTAEQSGEKV